ncbi:hypothetical protein FOZ62_026315 [Perkinsus olseni]|uniref:Uncharacterized protein n=1 Tax=Perkinsus olseni TaxID=32597 RepID=A0A7J6QL16_PEROL|nr:hypothetical protein FOZ62_026315 [Perkinsus olseni]
MLQPTSSKAAGRTASSSSSSAVDKRYGSPDPGGIPMQPMRGPQQRVRPQGDLLDVSTAAAAEASPSSSSSKERRGSNALMVDLEDSVTGALRKGHEAAVTLDPIRVIVFFIVIVALLFFATLGPTIPSLPQLPNRDLELDSVAAGRASGEGRGAAQGVSSAFLNACASGDRRSFQAILERYGRVLSSGDQQLCMHYALQGGEKGYLDIVSSLLSMGVDPVVEDPSGVSLLEVACGEGRVEAFDTMLRSDTGLCSSDSFYYFAGRAPTQEATRQLIEVIRKHCEKHKDGKGDAEVAGARDDARFAKEEGSPAKGRNYESEWSDMTNREKYSKELASLQLEVEKWRDRAFEAARQKQDLLGRIARLEAQLQQAKQKADDQITTTPPPAAAVEHGKKDAGADDEYERLWKDSHFGVVPDKPLTGGPADELLSSPLGPPPEGRNMFLS